MKIKHRVPVHVVRVSAVRGDESATRMEVCTAYNLADAQGQARGLFPEADGWHSHAWTLDARTVEVDLDVEVVFKS